MPTIPALRAGLGLLPAQVLVLDVVEHLLQSRRIVAAVVGEAGDDRVPVLEARDHVLQPDRGRIHPEGAPELVDQALDHERRFGTARAAIRLDRRGVRVHAVDVFLDRRHVVDARQHQAVQDGGDPWRRRRQIRAHAGPDRGAQPQNRPVLPRRELDFLDVIAAMRRRLVVLAARLGPLDRAVQPHRAEARDEVRRIRRDLAAEAAADFRGDHAELVLRHAGDDRAEEAQDVRVLRRVPERQLARRAAPLRERRARLHRVRNQPLLDDAFLDDDLGGPERRVDVAAGDGPVKRLVVRHVGVQLWRARLRARPGDRSPTGADRSRPR